ncbi:MAG: PASTA domain-containing protein [Paraprevotella sp.]|nr:PASTA domain-containing protein [Paraprevotella sp.]
MTFSEFKAKITSPILWGNLLGMAVFILLLAFGVWKGLDIYTHHGESIRVPDIKGMPLNEARYALNQAGLNAVVVDSSYNRNQQPGTILEQTPIGGTNVKMGRDIYLTLNSQHSPTVAIPDIADNCSLREAEARLKALGIKLAPYEYVEGESDWVYGVKCEGRTLSAGEHISKDTPVVLQVGKGYENDFSDSFADSLETTMPAQPDDAIDGLEL